MPNSTFWGSTNAKELASKVTKFTFLSKNSIILNLSEINDTGAILCFGFNKRYRTHFKGHKVQLPVQK